MSIIDATPNADGANEGVKACASAADGAGCSSGQLHEGADTQNAQVPNVSGESFGKFKSATELANAYSELERAFTKKCMELSTYKKQSAGAKSTTQNAAQNANAQNTAQSTTQNAAQNASAQNTAQSAAQTTAQSPTQTTAQSTTQTTAQSTQQSACVEGKPVSLTAAEILALANNENVQRAVVARYLKSVNSVKSVKLMGSKGGGSYTITPPHAPKSVEEAGKIARKYLGKK